MTARRLSVLSLPFFLVACAATSLAHAQESSAEGVLGPSVAPGGGSPYDGRFAASTYRFDSGSVLSGYGGGSANYDAVWVTRFDAAGGADAITSVTTPFAFTAVGTTATIYIWEDPDDSGNPANRSGNPANRVLIATVPVEVQSQCYCTTPLFNVFTLPQPVPVRGSFFLGVKVPGKIGEYPALFEASTPYAPNRSFAQFAAGFNPVTSPIFRLGSVASPVTWFIRANGSNSGFTYQGSLNVSGAAYTGSADLIATIYDAESGGAAMSPSFAIAGVSVTNGLFSVRIPADASSFDPGADRWLELGVKRATETGYTTLVPRQRITSVPTALAAARVDWSGLTNIPATLPPWNQVSGGISYSAGNVGIQTTTPTSLLEVGSFAVNGDKYIQINSVGGNAYRAGIKLRHFDSTNGFTIVSDERPNVNGLHFIDEEPGPLSFTRLFIENVSGNIGIGTTTPKDKLSILGGALSFASPANPVPFVGLDYDTTTDALRFRTNVGAASLNGTAMTINRTSGNVGIGTTSLPHKLNVNGNVSANNVVVPSSIRFKDHVTPLAGALDGLLKLDGVRFDWKPEYAATRPGREHDLGFVAEDVEKVFPELVFRDADGNVTGMDYSRLTAVAVAAIKEQQARFDADKAAKQREIDDLKARLERLESQFNARSNAK